MTVLLELTEWSTKSCPGIEVDAALLADVERINESSAIRAEVLYGGVLRVSASSWVGRVQLGPVTVSIRPKIHAPMLLEFVRYAFGLRNLRLFQSTPTEVRSSGLEDLLVLQLVAEVEELVARGLHRTYVERLDDLASPRGRIALDQIARGSGLMRATLPCNHRERETDHLLNRVVLAGLRAAAALTTSRILGRRATSLTGFFAGVAPSHLSRKLVEEAQRHLTRLTRAYESALLLIALLCEGLRASLGPDASVPLRGVLFDMNRLFQALLARFLRAHLDGLVLAEEESLRGVLAYDRAHNPFGRASPLIRPDFILRDGNGVRAILDAKYRDLSELHPSRDMLYQLALYASTNSAGREATILYPAQRDHPDQHILVRGAAAADGHDARVILRSVNLPRLHRLIVEPARNAEARAYCSALITAGTVPARSARVS